MTASTDTAARWRFSDWRCAVTTTSPKVLGWGAGIGAGPGVGPVAGAELAAGADPVSGGEASEGDVLGAGAAGGASACWAKAGDAITAMATDANKALLSIDYPPDDLSARTESRACSAFTEVKARL